MPAIAEIKEIDGEIWVRVGVAGEFANGLSIMSPEEIAAKEREYSKAYDHGRADAIKYMEERDSERESSKPTEGMCDRARGFIMGLDLNLRTWGAMQKHLDMCGAETLYYIRDKAHTDPKGHITKWDVADCIYQLMNGNDKEGDKS